jgi:hypothetical protein
MRHWFGGDRPSQLNSAKILPGKEDHFRQTIAGIHRLFDGPLVIKNAWNCFRIESLARLLPRAFFVWIRRDITQSALSDLAARYVVHGTPQTWTSATPGNVEQLRQLPCWAQVVENQYEFTRAIDSGLRMHAVGRHAEVWYEDFLRDPNNTLHALAKTMGDMLPDSNTTPILLGKAPRSLRPYSESDEANLREYVSVHESRLQRLRFQGNQKSERGSK